MPEISASGPRRFHTPYLTDTNGTAEPGSIVVGMTPFQRSAWTSVTRFGVGAERLGAGFDGGGLGFAVILIFEALASPFSRVASALAAPRRERHWPSHWTVTTGFYENAAVRSMETPAASMIASITSRNTSGSSRKTNRLAMKAPNISDEPAIRPCRAISGVSAPKR